MAHCDMHGTPRLSRWLVQRATEGTSSVDSYIYHLYSKKAQNTPPSICRMAIVRSSALTVDQLVALLTAVRLTLSVETRCPA